MKNEQKPIVVQGAMGVETQHIIDQMTEVREEPILSRLSSTNTATSLWEESC